MFSISLLLQKLLAISSCDTHADTHNTLSEYWRCCLHLPIELLEAQVAREEHGQAWIAAGQRSWIYLAEGGQVQGGWDVNPGKKNGVRPEHTGYIRIQYFFLDCSLIVTLFDFLMMNLIWIYSTHSLLVLLILHRCPPSWQVWFAQIDRKATKRCNELAVTEAHEVAARSCWFLGGC